jgi:hypothetical protein
LEADPAKVIGALFSRDGRARLDHKGEAIDPAGVKPFALGGRADELVKPVIDRLEDPARQRLWSRSLTSSQNSGWA